MSEVTTAAGRALLEYGRRGVLRWDDWSGVAGYLGEAIAAIEAEARADERATFDEALQLHAASPGHGALAAEKAKVARLRELVRELAHEYHAYGLVKDHHDPTDKTGWNVHGIETCGDVLCRAALAETADTAPSENGSGLVTGEAATPPTLEDE